MMDLTEQEMRFLNAYRAADNAKKKQVEEILFPKQFALVFPEEPKQEPKEYVLVREDGSEGTAGNS